MSSSFNAPLYSTWHFPRIFCCWGKCNSSSARLAQPVASRKPLWCHFEPSNSTQPLAVEVEAETDSLAFLSHSYSGAKQRVLCVSSAKRGMCSFPLTATPPCAWTAQLSSTGEPQSYDLACASAKCVGSSQAVRGSSYLSSR